MNLPDRSSSVHQFHGSHQTGLGQKARYGPITIASALETHLPQVELRPFVGLVTLTTL